MSRAHCFCGVVLPTAWWGDFVHEGGRIYCTCRDSIDGWCRSCGENGETKNEKERHEEGYEVGIRPSNLEFREWNRTDVLGGEIFVEYLWKENDQWVLQNEGTMIISLCTTCHQRELPHWAYKRIKELNDTSTPLGYAERTIPTENVPLHELPSNVLGFKSDISTWQQDFVTRPRVQLASSKYLIPHRDFQLEV
jgi:hypothetical protein